MVIGLVKSIGVTTSGYAVRVCKAQALSSGWKSFESVGRNHGEIIKRPKLRNGSRK